MKSTAVSASGASASERRRATSRWGPGEGAERLPKGLWRRGAREGKASPESVVAVAYDDNDAEVIYGIDVRKRLRGEWLAGGWK